MENTKMIIRLFYLILLIFISCNHSNQKNETIRVSVLRGPSAIAFAAWMDKAPILDGKRLSVRIIDSPELMQAALIKGEADIAVLPMISAANLYNKGIRYPLLGCPVWGTLYLIGKDTLTTTGTSRKTLHIFGAGTTPDILTRYYLKQHKTDYSLNYSFATAREIMQGLLTGKVETAVLGEPYLSMVLQKNDALHILADLNNPDSTSQGFAQTAVIYAPALAGKREILDNLLRESCRFVMEKPEEAIRILEDNHIFNENMLTLESIERCKIDYKPAAESEKSIEQFLQIIDEYEPEALGGKLPDKGFYK